MPLDIAPDVHLARTPDPTFYRDPAWYLRTVREVFPATWNFLHDQTDAPKDGVFPLTWMEGSIDEPLLAVRENGATSILSNVCTHRSALVVPTATDLPTVLRCPYHGRRFSRDGQCLSMPDYPVPGFPCSDDHLSRVSTETFGPCAFANLRPSTPLSELLSSLEPIVGWLPWDEYVPDPTGTVEYDVACHWALWCENYLEGYHIPWIHPGLAKTIDYKSYRSEIGPYGSLQTAYALDGEPAFELPEGHPESGHRVAAWYIALFPTTMINLYPWGLSLNLIRPQGPTFTKILYRRYLWRPDLIERGAGAGLAGVEEEDDQMNEQVQKGVRGLLAGRGRYQPEREIGVWHFHRQLQALLGTSNSATTPK